MKSSFASALTAALLVGAASTAFAASNPFEDVPADHWAYDAISQLAADGVIEGYGDGTFRGNQEITRYEMAQMVARAMAKGGGDKALIDKLAAEFADELNNLGVRVAALEKKVDNVWLRGIARYRYIHRTNAASPAPAARCFLPATGSPAPPRSTFRALPCVGSRWMGLAASFCVGAAAKMPPVGRRCCWSAAPPTAKSGSST